MPPLTAIELGRVIRQFTEGQLQRLIRELWKMDPLAFGNLRKAINDVSTEEVSRAQENWHERR